MDAELKALGQVAFSTVHKGRDIWRDDIIHVDGIHTWAFDRVLETLDRVRDGDSVGNLVIQGRPGIGKSHFLGRVRHAVVERGQVFVLFHPGSARRFWDGLAIAYMDAFHRDVAEGGTQLSTVFRGLGEAIGLQRDESDCLVAGTLDLTHLRAVRRKLQGLLGRQHLDQVALDVALALILANSEDFTQQDIGNALLQGQEVDLDASRAHFIRAAHIPCRDVVGAFDRLTGAAGLAALVAVDQLDGLVALGRSLSGGEQQLLLDQMATGLMDLAEDVQHSLVVVSCLIDTWTLIRERSVASAHDRYPAAVYLRPIPSARVGVALIAAYLRVAYTRAGFTPPYATWPVPSTAFADADQFTPRGLINLVQAHCARGVEQGCVTELTELKQLPDESGPGGEHPPREEPLDPVLDQRFRRLVQEATVADALDEKTVDHGLPPLLRAGLSAWAEENAAAGDFTVDPPPGRKPSLHARLRRIVDAGTDDEVHSSFRAVLNANPMASLNRLRAAVTASGLELSRARRRLFVLRNSAWSQGPKTQQALDGFRTHGGTVVTLPEVDLKVFRALQQLLEEQPTGLATWLRERRHATQTALLAPLSAERAASAALAEAGESREAASPSETAELAGVSGPVRAATPSTSAQPAGAAAPPAIAALPTIAAPPSTVAPTTTPSMSAQPAGAAAPPPTAAPPTTAAPTATPPTSAESAGVAALPTTTAPPTTAARPENPARSETAATSEVAKASRPAAEDSILIGTAEGTGWQVTVPLADLRRHTVIFAGSGSGKTVLIRRLVEECALKGVSAVVLDPNNDLARLGLPWPEPPGAWLPGDAEKAVTYLRDTEVVVWTPRLTTGRPLSFEPLVGLRDVADDPDEFGIALDNAVASLVPRAGLPASGAKLSQGRAVLKEALAAFVQRGGGDLKRFLGYLSALPAGVSRLAGGPKLAATIAETLLAETVNDPMLGGTGEAVDPSVLLQPEGRRRARISVISLVGLPNDEQRQHFVNQLQMALFAWVKKHPAGDRPLGGLFVMDEAQSFAPSTGRTATTDSTLALASQARKYGLGLIFATQAPKGLHNRIAGNATTQFFGLLNAPVQIAAAKEMAAQKGGDARGIARLRPGEFFTASDGVTFQRVRSPMCLSHHPRSAMTQEEILTLARVERPRA